MQQSVGVDALTRRFIWRALNDEDELLDLGMACASQPRHPRVRGTSFGPQGNHDGHLDGGVTLKRRWLWN